MPFGVSAARLGARVNVARKYGKRVAIPAAQRRRTLLGLSASAARHEEMDEKVILPGNLEPNENLA